MSRSYNTTKQIPRSAFPMKKGETIISKKGVVMTVDSDMEDVESSFCFTAPTPSGCVYEMVPGVTEGIKEAYVWLYFTNGYLSFYDMGYDQAWSGAGTWLLNEIKSLTRGKYLKIDSNR